MAYSYYRAITIDHTKVPNTDQSNFPVLIKGTYSWLATVAHSGKLQSSSGYDFVFATDNAGNNLLPYEVVSWDATSGAVTIWVNVPSLSHTSDTVIYILYGNASVSQSLANPRDTWQNNRAAFHFGDGTTLSVVDSSGVHVGVAGTTAAATGKVDGGVGSFTGSNYFDLGAARDDIFGDHSYSFWINLSSTDAAATRVMLSSYAGSGEWFVLGWVSGQIVATANGNDTGHSLQSSSNLSSGWHHIAITKTSTGSLNPQKIFLDGVDVTQAATGGNHWGAPGAGNSLGSEIGSFGLTSGTVIDEYRIDNVQHTVDWFNAHINMITGTFYSVGSETSIGGGGGGGLLTNPGMSGGLNG